MMLTIASWSILEESCPSLCEDKDLDWSVLWNREAEGYMDAEGIYEIWRLFIG